MRSRSNARLHAVMMAVLLMAALSLQAAPAQESVRTNTKAEAPGETEIARAIETVKADPNLATERTVKTLKWKDPIKPTRSSPPGWFKWIGELFRWIDQSARVLVWVAAAVLAVWLVIYVTRMVRSYRLPRREQDAFVAPTHVRDLDIRPEALPPDIGAAARALWDRGEHRASLALLYRGLLSRLAHVHRMPIRDSSTEGDCLALAARHLTPHRLEYAARLVRVWQRAVYGREDIQAATVHGLCDDFASAIDAASSPLDGATPEGAPQGAA